MYVLLIFLYLLVSFDCNLPFEYDEDHYRLIYELLCSRRVDEAVEVAQTANLHRLALTLSQLQTDDTVAEIMTNQLILWESQNYENIDPSLLDIYRLIGMNILFFHFSYCIEFLL